MTFEEALTKVSKMTPAEKDALPALYLRTNNPEDNNGQIIEFLSLELDAETQAPIDDTIQWLEVQQRTLPDGTYKTGDIVSFNIGGKERLFQILEYDVFDISGLLPPR